MKFRSGFVSNSSSSSFIIKRKYISDSQLEMIEKHFEYAKKLLEDMDEEKRKGMWGGEGETFFGYMGEFDKWEITITEESVKGETIMDNFEMHLFLREIGIKDEYIKWEDY